MQCNIEVPEHCKTYLPISLQSSKTPSSVKKDLGDLMKIYVEEEGLLSQPRKMLNSSFSVKNGTLITPFSLFYLDFGLVCTKLYRFVEYTPMENFNNFVQSTMKQGDENPKSKVVTETMKLLANSSCGYQIRDRSRHTVEKYYSDEKTHVAINNKMITRLGFMN